MNQMTTKEMDADDMQPFSVSFVAYGGICIAARTADEAYDTAKRMLDHGEMDDFLENLSENPWNFDILDAVSVDQ